MVAGPEARVPSYWECFSTFCQQTILHGWHYLTPEPEVEVITN